MESAAIKSAGVVGMRGPSPFLRLQSDERLVALTRRGNQAAYEVLVGRYDARMLAFCRHMLGSKEDAEDVVQETFAAAYNAMVADERPINVKPWLYRIARNRSLNHLRRQSAIAVDSLEHHVADHGSSTADKVDRREDLRQLVADIQDLAETQRTALLLREIDALSYEQIAEAMETTVPSVKSLLVRARVSLAEAAEARKLSCEEVRLELGEVAEGLKRISPPVRRHVRSCERCAGFRRELRQTNKALALMLPFGPLLVVKKLFLAQLGTTAGAGGGVVAGVAASGTVGTAAGGAAGGALSAGMSAVVSKAAATVAAAAIVTAGAVEVRHARNPTTAREPAAVVAQAPPAPRPALATPAAEVPDRPAIHRSRKPAEDPDAPVAPPVSQPAPAVAPDGSLAPAAPPAPSGTQEEVDDIVLPPPPTQPPAQTAPPVDPAALPEVVPPPPPAGAPAATTPPPAPVETLTPPPDPTPAPSGAPTPPAPPAPGSP